MLQSGTGNRRSSRSASRHCQYGGEGRTPPPISAVAAPCETRSGTAVATALPTSQRAWLRRQTTRTQGGRPLGGSLAGLRLVNSVFAARIRRPSRFHSRTDVSARQVENLAYALQRNGGSGASGREIEDVWQLFPIVQSVPQNPRPGNIDP